MKITANGKNGKFGSTLEGFFKSQEKLAAKEVLSTVSVSKSSDWKTNKLIIEAALQDAATAGTIELVDIEEFLTKLSANGLKIGNGTKEDLIKEAQGFWGNLGQWMQGAGQWAGEKGKQWQDQAKQKQLQDLKNQIYEARGSIGKALVQLRKIDPDLANKIATSPVNQLDALVRSDLAGVPAAQGPAAAGKGTPQQGQGQIPQIAPQQGGQPGLPQDQYGVKTLPFDNKQQQPQQDQYGVKTLPFNQQQPQTGIQQTPEVQKMMEERRKAVQPAADKAQQQFRKKSPGRK